MFTVTLSLPECAGDFQADGNEGEPTPVDAVNDFISQSSGQPDLWTYRVKNDSTGEEFLVDMAGGPSVKPTGPTKKE